jgi:hypothetical protein
MNAECKIKDSIAEGNRQKNWLVSKASRWVGYKYEKE